ncbi:MAG: hypothetical protein KC444_06185 [Nitrosopumilus sp.]|nr:hypothetical protein [Nitrosopumilus sp.]
MKTRNLIITVGIVIVVISMTSISLAYNQEIKLIMGMQTDDKPSIDTSDHMDLSGLTYKDFGISSSEPVYLIEIRTDEQLRRVLDKCEYKQRKESGEIPNFTPDGKLLLSTQPLVSWNNSTHYIDNNICYFQSLKEHLEHGLLGGILEYCNSDKGAGWDNPFEVWFANETHYIDSDTCLWQLLDNDVPLVLPDNWKNVYDENN